jgi:hypothetical protein
MDLLKFIFFNLCVIYMFSLGACNNHKEYNAKRTREKQEKTIDSLFTFNSKELKYEFYDSDSSIIKSAFRYYGSKIVGKKINFFPNGNIESVAFFNQKGEKVGDECVFFPNQTLSHCYFWGSNDNLFFKIEFDWYGNIRSKEGKPYYVERPSFVEKNEEILIYVATPIVPRHSTEVTIGEVDDSTTHVKYINDIRQFRYKISYKEHGMKQFFLKVNILGKDTVCVVSDSIQFQVKVQ